ncbi:tail assembly protein [Pseudomonas petrae]|uniref:tail assembly protein n=1 Tax=Pseudomonas petrae TaxID=2912190 RepID=UPI001F1C4953|nr:tail assembly protein [Pseudomonas petrae]MCF7555118.1 tail assembly protein [Pseudomonas petrae]
MSATAAHYTPKTRIYLSGSLARKFFRFKDYQLDSGCANEGFKALKNTVDGFAAEVARLARLGMRFAIYRNRRNIGEDGFGMSGAREIRIVPVIAGAKRAGVLQTVLGIVLIVVGAYSKNPNLIAAGVAMTAGGVIQMLSPQASGLRQSGSPDNLPSYAFGSAKNTTASGNPVPICIGHRRWGGAIISASIYAEDKV